MPCKFNIQQETEKTVQHYVLQFRIILKFSVQEGSKVEASIPNYVNIHQGVRRMMHSMLLLLLCKAVATTAFLTQNQAGK